MIDNRAAILLTLVCASTAGCFATQDESLGQVVHDAGQALDANLPVPVRDAAPPPIEDADAALNDHDAGHDAGNADAGHAVDAARDARTGCREPWEPWECR